MFVWMSKAKNPDKYPLMSTLAPYTACQTVTTKGKSGTTHIFLGADDGFYCYYTWEKKGRHDSIPQVRELIEEKIRVDIKHEVPVGRRSITECSYPEPSFEKLRLEALEYFRTPGLAEKNKHWHEAKCFRDVVLAARATLGATSINKIFTLSNIIGGVKREPVITNDVESQRDGIAAIRPMDANTLARGRPKNEVSEIIVDLTEAMNTIDARFERHDAIVRRLVDVCNKQGFYLREERQAYDLLAWKDKNKALLFETKTTSADDVIDAHKQVRRAIGQLKYYKHFEVQPKMPEAEIVEIIVCETKPDDALIIFCETIGISLIWETDNGFATQTIDGIRIFEPDEF